MYCCLQEVDIKHVLHSKLQDMRNRGNIVDEESELQLLNSTYENKVIKGLNIYIRTRRSVSLDVITFNLMYVNLRKLNFIYVGKR